MRTGGGALELAGHAGAAVAEGNDGVQLLYAIKKRIRGPTDTRRVVALVVRERLLDEQSSVNRANKNGGQKRGVTYAPFATRVDDAITEHESTRTTHEVSTAKLFDDIWVWVSAIGTDKSHCEVWAVESLLGFRGRGEGEGLGVSHGSGDDLV